jgi:hypothetical protein
MFCLITVALSARRNATHLRSPCFILEHGPACRRGPSSWTCSSPISPDSPESWTCTLYGTGSTGAFSSATGHCSGGSASCSILRLAGTIGSGEDIAFTRCEFSCAGSRQAMDHGLYTNWTGWDVGGCVLFGLTVIGAVVGIIIAYRCGCCDNCCCTGNVRPTANPVAPPPFAMTGYPAIAGYAPFASPSIDAFVPPVVDERLST